MGVSGAEGGIFLALSEHTDPISGREMPSRNLAHSFSLDAQFPIDISSVTGDHDFLDRDAIEALCR